MRLNLGTTASAIVGVLLIMQTAPVWADQFKAGVVAYENGLYEEAAAIWTRIAQRNNDAAAQYNLGLLYEQGLGVEESSGLAARYYRAAARQDYAPAQYNLAGLHYRGNGVVQDAREAVYWWSAAAQQGYANAQYMLGVLLLKGEVVPGNPDHAIQWLELAAENGHEEAANLLTRIRDARLESANLVPPTASSQRASLFSDIDWILKRAPSNFTVELHETDSDREAELFIRNHGIEDVATYYKRGGQYVIIGGAYEKREHAQSAIAKLTDSLRRLDPRVMTFATIHDELETGDNNEN